MHRVFRFLLIVTVLAAALIFAQSPRPAAAAGCVIYDSSAGGTVTFIAGHTYSLTQSLAPGFSLTLTFVAGVTGPVGPTLFPAGDQITITDESETCGGGGDWWHPNDSRVNPQANDRVAVYCNLNATGTLANTIAVFGILDDGQGKPLVLFNYADIVKAGDKGITKSVEPLGTVYISVGSDKTSFYVKWMGGPADATGMGDFRKRFTCSFK